MKKHAFPLEKKMILCTLVALIMLAGCSKDPALLSETAPEGLDPYVKSSISLTEGEIESIMFMVEEEKLAMDVYEFLYQLYELKIFAEINASECNHVNAISHLIEKHELSNPIDGNLPGEFEDESLQQLYNELVDYGSTSKKKALEVGVMIEEKDITDIQHDLDYIIEAKDVTRVYTHLLEGSNRHLASFLSELN